MRNRFLLTIFCLLTVCPMTVAGAYSADLHPEVPDSTVAGAKTAVLHPESIDSMGRLPIEQFRWSQLIVPGTLLATGAFGAYSQWYMDKVNIPVRDYALQLSGGQRLRFDDYIQYIPTATFLGLGCAVECEHSFTERLCITATSYASMGILVNAAKYTIREPRPDRPEARNAFPSGHTATAFMGAELVRREYGGWWGAGAYAIATTTALMRIYNDRHWTSDVLGGAAIGILSADIGFWLLPLERRLFRLDGSRRGGPGPGIGSGKAIAVLPTPYGISVACVF